MTLVLGPELLTNGDFEQSVGQGASSVAGPGWTSAYIMCGPNLFNAPCTGGRMGYFTGPTACQLMPSGPCATIPVLGSRSLGVNVGQSLTTPILEWANIPLVTGRQYRLTVTAAIVFGPFAVAVKIDGGAQGQYPVTAPTVAGQWQTTITDFEFTGPSGNYPVGLYSNSTAFAGNDHTFDNISLRAAADDVPCSCCPLTQEIRCHPAGRAVAMNCSGNVVWFDLETGGVVDASNITDCASP